MIGAGAAGTIHAKLLSERGYRVAVYDAQGGRAARLAREIDGGATADYLTDADFTVIAVPTAAHYEYARTLLDAGRVVVCEKPLTLYPEQAAELVQSGDGRLYIAESQGYGADQQQQQAAIEGGRYGRPVMWRVCAMSAYRSQEWSYDLHTGGGAFLEGGAHVATVARMLFGQAVAWHGAVRCFAGGSGPDTGQLIIEYERGDMLTLQIAWATADCWSGQCRPLANSAGLIGPQQCTTWWPGDNHAAMWDALLPAIAEGRQPLVTAAHAAGAVADIWRCYRAAGVGVGAYVEPSDD